MLRFRKKSFRYPGNICIMWTRSHTILSGERQTVVLGTGFDDSSDLTMGGVPLWKLLSIAYR